MRMIRSFLPWKAGMLYLLYLFRPDYIDHGSGEFAQQEVIASFGEDMESLLKILFWALRLDAGTTDRADAGARKKA